MLLLFSSLIAFAQLTLLVNAVPNNTPADATIYVAGNFNGWSEGDPAYALELQGDGSYRITIEPAAGQLEFKFTRGSWQTVEGNENGGFRPNRTLSYDGSPTTAELQILSWEGDGGTSTAADNVSIISEDFYMPQLQRSRRIWVYLPPDYESSSKSYPVLYMHDGQNLFDAANSAFGEWEVDETLNALFAAGDRGVIVVGVDNGGALRLDEYSPWANPTYGGGEGAAYIDFIVETLKPYIDEQYRTQPGAAHTGIMGSSMGGLISLYAILQYPEVFHKAGVFSASLWFADEIYDMAAAAGMTEGHRIYMIAGQEEGSGGSQVAEMLEMESTLLGAGYGEGQLAVTAHADGEHSEWYWRREFGDAYEWLFGTVTSNSNGLLRKPKGRVKVYPNPVKDTLFLEYKGKEKKGVAVELYNEAGKQLMPLSPLVRPALDLQGVLPGVYVLKIYDGQRLISTKRIVKQ